MSEIRDLGTKLENLLAELDLNDEYGEYLTALNNLSLCSVIPEGLEAVLIQQIQEDIAFIENNTRVETKTVVKQTHVDGVLVESYTNTCTTREWIY